jgi:hypothetical protein
MEPASVVALVGSGLTIVTKTLKNLHDLSTKVNNVEQSVQMILAKLSTLRAALSQLVLFLESESTQGFITPQLQSDIESSMHPCTVVMTVIDQHVSQIHAGWLRGAVRYV